MEIAVVVEVALEVDVALEATVEVDVASEVAVEAIVVAAEAVVHQTQLEFALTRVASLVSRARNGHSERVMIAFYNRFQ